MFSGVRINNMLELEVLVRLGFRCWEFRGFYILKDGVNCELVVRK